MEYFARCPATLSKWARHYITGEEVPTQLLLQALEGSAVLPAVDLQMQVLYSAVDQVNRGCPCIFALCFFVTYRPPPTFVLSTFHRMHPHIILQHVFGTGIGDVSSLSHKEVFERANSDIVAVQERYTALPVGAFASMNMLDHGHLVNYGGKHNLGVLYSVVLCCVCRLWKLIVSKTGCLSRCILRVSIRPLVLGANLAQTLRS